MIGASLKAATGQATAVKLQTEERDAWKAQAPMLPLPSQIGWIADGLPLPPTNQN